MAAIRREDNKKEQPTAVEQVVEATETVEAEVPKVKTSMAKQKPQIDLREMVPCRNITNGSLTYISKKTGTVVKWTNFGDIEYIDVAELLTMKSGQPRFFNEPWIMIDDEDVIDYLGLRQIYDKIINPDEIEYFFSMSVDEITDKLGKASHGTKELVASKAREMIENETLYDNRVIRAIEKALSIDLSMVTK
jgi:hypothetical protein